MSISDLCQQKTYVQIGRGSIRMGSKIRSGRWRSFSDQEDQITVVGYRIRSVIWVSWVLPNRFTSGSTSFGEIDEGFALLFEGE